jgi:hypothetical protein
VIGERRKSRIKETGKRKGGSKDASVDRGRERRVEDHRRTESG